MKKDFGTDIHIYTGKTGSGIFQCRYVYQY